MRCLLLIIISIVTINCSDAQDIYSVENGTIDFRSSAEFEIISARSDKLQGAVDIRRKQFAFKIEIPSFQGFNSPLQKEHFNENYMESAQYPTATFRGKIIEDVDISKKGTYEIRAKGKLKVHGVVQERIINATITSAEDNIQVKSSFVVALADHDIKIPRIVNDKLSNTINVNLTANMMLEK